MAAVSGLSDYYRHLEGLMTSAPVGSHGDGREQLMVSIQEVRDLLQKYNTVIAVSAAPAAAAEAARCLATMASSVEGYFSHHYRDASNLALTFGTSHDAVELFIESKDYLSDSKTELHFHKVYSAVILLHSLHGTAGQRIRVMDYAKILCEIEGEEKQNEWIMNKLGNPFTEESIITDKEFGLLVDYRQLDSDYDCHEMCKCAYSDLEIHGSCLLDLAYADCIKSANNLFPTFKVVSRDDYEELLRKKYFALIKMIHLIFKHAS